MSQFTLLSHLKSCAQRAKTFSSKLAADLADAVAGAVGEVSGQLTAHTDDATKHITAAERAAWNSKTATSAAKLATARKIGGALFDGSSDVNPYEEYLNWGGADTAGGCGPLDMAISEELSANRLAYMPPEDITVEYSTDGGSTWVDYGASNNSKTDLVTTSSSFTIGKKSSGKVAITDKLRITLKASYQKIHFSMKKVMIYLTTAGAWDTKVNIEYAKNGSDTTFVALKNNVPVSGWPGWNVININNVFGGRDTQTTHYRKLRFTFSIGRLNGDGYNSALTVLSIRAYGENCWNYQSSLAKTGHLYTYDAAKNAAFPANVTADSFSGEFNGNANSATKLATARSVRTNLGSASAVNFDGTANITPGITGILPITNGGTDAATAEAARNNLGAAAASDLTSHSNDTTKHITAAERENWNNKQGKLAFDTAPTAESENPVTSGGVYTALLNKVPWDGFSNPNLLDNWYFANPINQLGQTTYTDGISSADGIAKGYTIDRWYSLRDADVTIIDGEGIELYATAMNRVTWWCQNLDTPTQYNGKTLTLSFLINAPTGTAGEIHFMNSGYGSLGGMQFDGEGKQLLSKTIIANDKLHNVGILLDVNMTPESPPVMTYAAKLELGSRQTLAHQDVSGNWVLNDPPPNKALELLKCQRYQVELANYSNNSNGDNIIGTGFVQNNRAYIFCPVPVPLRTLPSIEAGGSATFMNGVTSLSISHYDIDIDCISTNGVTLSASLVTQVDPGSGYMLRANAGTHILLNANL